MAFQRLFVDLSLAAYIFIARIWVKYQRSQCSGSLPFFYPSTVDRSLHPKAWIRLPNICTEYKGGCRMTTHVKLLFLTSLHLCFLYLFFTHIFWVLFSYHHVVSKSRYEIIIELSKK